MSGRTVAIHQPNFFPWLGFFDKLCRSDVFVMLDGVQLAQGRGGNGNWSNRVRVLKDGHAAWLTAPVKRSGQGLQSIQDVQLADDQPWRAKMLNTLRATYGRAPSFAAVMPCVESIMETATTSLAEFNVHAIDALLGRLGVAHGRVIRQCDLAAEGRATELLIHLVQAAGGSAYLCGGGSGGYLDAAAFARAGLTLSFQQYQHPVYEQRGGHEFVPGLSILDALMHCGFDGVRDMLAERGR